MCCSVEQSASRLPPEPGDRQSAKTCLERKGSRDARSPATATSATKSAMIYRSGRFKRAAGVPQIAAEVVAVQRTSGSGQDLPAKTVGTSLMSGSFVEAQQTAAEQKGACVMRRDLCSPFNEYELAVPGHAPPLTTAHGVHHGFADSVESKYAYHPFGGLCSIVRPMCDHDGRALEISAELGNTIRIGLAPLHLTAEAPIA